LYWLGPEGWRRWWLLPVTVAAILVVHVMTLASYRFTIPLLPVLYVLASGPTALVAHRVLHLLRMRVVAVVAAILVAAAIAAQFESWPLRTTYHAAALEGLSAANVADDTAGSLVRFGDAARGTRPIALLPDTYLPRGSLRVTTRMRAIDAGTSAATPVARIALVPLAGDPGCVADVVAAQLRSDRFTDVTTLCRVERDGPVTLAVFTLGQVDLAVSSVHLTWVN
jgi:hypothetical protein